MVCRKTNQIIWYFYQVITDKYSIIGLNNSPRSNNIKGLSLYDSTSAVKIFVV